MDTEVNERAQAKNIIYIYIYIYRNKVKIAYNIKYNVYSHFFRIRISIFGNQLKWEAGVVI